MTSILCVFQSDWFPLFFLTHLLLFRTFSLRWIPPLQEAEILCGMLDVVSAERGDEEVRVVVALDGKR